MINLRYHIVSITAVFLALGIGLAFGASFIDRATVDRLETNLNDIEGQNDRLETENARLNDLIDDASAVEEGLRSQGLTQLVEGDLADVPVLLLANAGVDDDVAAASESALLAAGAELAGVLRVTDRFALDDDGELDDLRTVLGLPTAAEVQLRTAVTRQVVSLLRDAAGPDLGTGGGLTPVTPPLLEALLANGFLELDPVDQPDPEVGLLAGSGVRVVVLSGPGSNVTDDGFLGPVVRGLAGVDITEPDAPVPVVVVAEPTAPPVEEGADPPPPSLVATFRSDEVLRERLSTVDGVETFAGLAATVLALAHGEAGQAGHYGVADDAQSLLPPALVAPGDG